MKKESYFKREHKLTEFEIDFIFIIFATLILVSATTLYYLFYRVLPLL